LGNLFKGGDKSRGFDCFKKFGKLRCGGGELFGDLLGGRRGKGRGLAKKRDLPSSLVVAGGAGGTYIFHIHVQLLLMDDGLGGFSSLLLSLLNSALLLLGIFLGILDLVRWQSHLESTCGNPS